MKPFSQIEGQEQARALLTAAVVSGRLAHAYILAGPDGSGRLSAAIDLAKVHICRESKYGFCGECRHCSQITGYSHPDVRFTVPSLKSSGPDELAELLRTRAEDGITPLRFPGNTYISIEQIRELEARLSRKSFEGRGYVEIVTDAHLMRREAANAMLKTLEEPPGGTLIILITSSLSGLLPTVRSRAHTIRFGRLTAESVEKVLLKRGVESSAARKLSLCSDGCPGRALDMSRTELQEIPHTMELFKAAASGLPPMEIASLAGETARQLGRDGTLDLCNELISLAHDARRSATGAEPLQRESVPAISGLNDSMLETIITSMRLCRTRIKANVSPAMALAAALAAAAEKV